MASLKNYNCLNQLGKQIFLRVNRLCALSLKVKTKVIQKGAYSLSMPKATINYKNLQCDQILSTRKYYFFLQLNPPTENNDSDKKTTLDSSGTRSGQNTGIVASCMVWVSANGTMDA